MPSDLVAFLERTERMAGYPQAARADLVIRRSDGSTTRGLLVVDPKAGKLLLALQKPPWRALMPLDWGKGKALHKGRVVTWDANQPAPGTELRPMEFFPFWRGNYESAFVSDETTNEKTVMLYTAKKTPYELFVITFDKTKLTPLEIKYYEESMSNLVRLRRNSGFVMVGSRPRPAAIEIDDFAENRHCRIELKWQAEPELPEGLLDEAKFATVPLTWSESGAAP